MSLAAEGHQVEIVAAKACQHPVGGELGDAPQDAGGWLRGWLIGERREPEA